MRKKRQFSLSRLKIAWLALVLGLGAGAVAVWVAPPKEEVPTLSIDLPASPERFATGPARDGAPGESAPDEAPLPEVIRGEPTEVAAADAPAAVAGIATEEEELPDGTLRITIPGAEGGVGQTARGGATAPIAALVADGEFGKTPRIGADGTTPFAAYRHRAIPTREPQVAVILSGLGLDPALTEEAINRLPPQISFSFAPYGKDVDVLMAKAMAAGHEVAVELPMEAPGVSPESLGPAGLMVSRGAEANDKRLEWLLARAPAYPMATNYLGATFGTDRASMALLMARLKAHGLGYVDDTGLAAEAAAEFGVPYGRVNVVVPRGAGLAAQGLGQLTAASSEGRPMLARLYVSADAIAAIDSWAEGLGGQGIALVPASAVVDRR